MPVPAVTCGAKIVLTWNEGGGTYTAALSAVATNSPTSWTWTILSVPVGLEALLTGAWGNFTDGVATTGPGSTSAVSLANIPTATASGTIVIQCVAVNGSGSSVPTTDRAAGQQCVVIKTALLDLPLPGNKQFDWGEGQLDEVLRKVEANNPLADFLQAMTPLPSLALPAGDATYFDVTGLTLNITTLVANETILLVFEGCAVRTAGSQTCYIQFMVDGVAVNDSQCSKSSGANVGLGIGISCPYKIPAAGDHVAKVRAKYMSGYGPWTMWDGTFSILRRIP